MKEEQELIINLNRDRQGVPQTFHFRGLKEREVVSGKFKIGNKLVPFIAEMGKMYAHAVINGCSILFEKNGCITKETVQNWKELARARELLNNYVSAPIAINFSYSESEIWEEYYNGQGV